jgi:hypothetical protein
MLINIKASITDRNGTVVIIPAPAGRLRRRPRPGPLDVISGSVGMSSLGLDRSPSCKTSLSVDAAASSETEIDKILYISQ